MKLKYYQIDEYAAFFDVDKVGLEKDFDDDILILRSAKPQGPHWYSL